MILGRFSSGIDFLVPTMTLVLKRMYNRSALTSVCALYSFLRENVSMEVRILCEKAPVMTDTQTEQFGNFVKNGGTTSHL